jgi:hypothetical protein
MSKRILVIAGALYQYHSLHCPTPRLLNPTQPKTTPDELVIDHVDGSRRYAAGIQVLGRAYVCTDVERCPSLPVFRDTGKQPATEMATLDRINIRRRIPG